MGSTYARSLVKGVCWEVISFIITFAIVYLIYGGFKTSFLFSLALTLIKSSLFFFHERAWKRVKWGKIKEKE